MGRPSDTMSVMRSFTSGGRTRNVINIAAPGHTGSSAYAFTATSDAPSNESDGFANFGQNRFLHVHVSGNIATGGGAQVLLWGYNEFAKVWGPLQVKDPTNDVKFVNAQLTASKDDYRKYYIFDVAGTNRIAAECTSFGSNGTVYVYLGVNSY
jgi:hypothetical protein